MVSSVALLEALAVACTAWLIRKVVIVLAVSRSRLMFPAVWPARETVRPAGRVAAGDLQEGAVIELTSSASRNRRRSKNRQL